MKDGREGTRINGNTANRIVKKLCALAGIAKRITNHSLRHSIASHLAFNGATEIKVKAFLRHSRNTDTGRYVHMTMQDISDIYHSSINDTVDKKPDTPTQKPKPQEKMNQVPELDSRNLYKKLVTKYLNGEIPKSVFLQIKKNLTSLERLMKKSLSRIQMVFMRR